MAEPYDLKIDQGTTFRRVFTWQDNAGVAIPLTGYQARMEIRREPGSVVLETFTSSPAAGLVITAVAGSVALTIAAPISSAWTFRTAVYDLLLWSATEDDRLIEGAVFLNPQVTVKP